MRFRIVSLRPPLHSAVEQRLSAAGHEASDASADALVVGLGSPPEPVAVLDLGADEWAEIIGRLRSAVMVVQRFAAELIERGNSGRVVLVIEATTLRVSEGSVGSAVPGAFLKTFAQVAAVELGSLGFAVNVLAAGWMSTDHPALVNGIPLGRLAAPHEIAAACDFLLSDGASFVTGAMLVADGGYVITKASGGARLPGSGGIDSARRAGHASGEPC